MKTGKNKKTRISYFSVLYNISKNRNDRRRTPKILSLSVYEWQKFAENPPADLHFCPAIIARSPATGVNWELTIRAPLSAQSYDKREGFGKSYVRSDC